jgi:hypothetical protein
VVIKEAATMTVIRRNIAKEAVSMTDTLKMGSIRRKKR